jgi:hypothetical protein
MNSYSSEGLDTRLRGYDAYCIYLMLIALLSFPRRRESRKWENPTFYETINCLGF